jgi:hypothetical protein
MNGEKPTASVPVGWAVLFAAGAGRLRRFRGPAVFLPSFLSRVSRIDCGGRAAGRQGRVVAAPVRDTGAGIAAEQQAHIFELFSPVAPVLERSQDGLGLGFSWVKGLGEGHGRILAREPRHRQANHGASPRRICEIS